MKLDHSLSVWMEFDGLLTDYRGYKLAHALELVGPLLTVTETASPHGRLGSPLA